MVRLSSWRSKVLFSEEIIPSDITLASKVSYINDGKIYLQFNKSF